MTMTDTTTTATTITSVASDPHSVPSMSTLSFSAGQFQQLMAAVEVLSSVHASLEDKLEKFKQDLIKEQEFGAEKLAKKARLEKPQVFRSKGNEEQHRLSWKWTTPRWS